MKVCDLTGGIAGAYCTRLLDATPCALGEADAVVWSRDATESLDDVRAAAPDAIVVAITPFGLEGPWADKPATELTLQAWSGGMIGLGRGYPDRAPVPVGGKVGEWLTGVYAAIAVLVSAPGALVDVSMLECIALCLTYYPVTYHDLAGRPFRIGRSVVTPGIEEASDGLVGLGVGTGQQWLDFCVMVGHPEWQEDRKLFASRGHLAPDIAAWVADHTVAEVLELASVFRIPHAPIGNGATIPETDHFVARGSIVRDADGVVRPAPPIRTSVKDRPSSARKFLHRSVGELRVVDLTAFWAGPLCTQVLAMLGAEVIHVESTTRPDGTRMLAGMRGDDWWERSGIFSGLNTNKKSVTLDLQTERGRELLQQLVDTADVVVENFTPRVMDQMALDLSRDDLVVVRMPGFGLDGPWRDNPAFAFVIEDAAGLSWMTGYPDRKPLSPYTVGDPNAGLHALVGLLQALEHRNATGQGVTVEAAMVDAALSIAAEQLVTYSRDGVLLTRDGGARTYLTAEDDTWVVVDTDGDFTDYCATRKADEIVDELWAQGVPVAKVMQPHEQGDVAQLVARGFFEDVVHPIAGTARHPRLPFGIGGPQHRRHAPLLGEHNADVLGLPDDELAVLEAEGVIGQTPVS
ncbi:MAG TPA: CoA transferase [Acidimicrobiales bacterium]|nr:CoA transferase [Acidimicrobiales bacterium]